MSLSRGKTIALAVALLAALVLVVAWPSPPERVVVVYTSVDQVYAEPVLKVFEEQTGIRVLPVYDVEAAKTTGLVHRLIAEKDRPLADVFWNNEFAQTLRLKEKGVLAARRSPAAAGIPDQWLDPEGYWTGVGGRARVLLVNTTLVAPEAYPRSLADLLRPDCPGEKTGMAYPLFGTMATHAAALYAAWGPDQARAYFEQLKAHGVRVVDGNSVVRDMVASGQLRLGLTDSDDAWGALERKAPVAVVQLDEAAGGLPIIPGTVALIAGAPHPAEGSALVDYLLSPEVERALLQSGCAQLSLRTGEWSGAGGALPPAPQTRVNLAEIWRQLPRVQKELAEVFSR